VTVTVHFATTQSARESTVTTTAADQRTTVELRPRREGANIRTWIGFKQFMYLAEEAVLDWFRRTGPGAAQLYLEHGLELSIVDSSVQLPAVLELDDVVDAEVTGGPRVFTVRLFVHRTGTRTVLRGRVTVALVRTSDRTSVPAPPPAALAGLVVDDIGAAGVPGRRDLPAGSGDGPATVLAASGGFLWSWRVPYYYCQFSMHLQYSGYVRAMEEVVDRYLADRGLSVGTMLRQRGWIPVVSRARIGLLADVAMEETVHTVFTVTDVVKNIGFEARMDCYVARDAGLVHTATGGILHGYAVASGPGAGGLATLDAATVSALTAGRVR
jgi:acyl-CoA thioesterase FadM